MRPSPPDGLFNGRYGPKIITISGANKDIGKSSLAAFLAGRCHACAGIKVTVHVEPPPGPSAIEEGDPPDTPGTDTARMLEAGARPVFWMRTTLDDLETDLEEVLPRLSAPVVIVEGNSVLEHLEPDFAVFIMGPTFDDFKPSAHQAIAKADTVVINGEKQLSGAQVLRLEREVKERNPRAKVVVVSELGRERAREIILSRAVGRLGGEFMSAETDDRIKKAVEARAKEGRIPCAVALKLAEEMGVPAIEVGNAANELNIKIVKCSLGCF